MLDGRDLFAGSPDRDFIRRQPVRMFSEDAEPADWILIAESIIELDKEGLDGCLVLHGTDTMAFTAAYLSFALAGLAFPVVLTGSSVPGHDPDSDAMTNIEDALVALDGLPPGVYVSFSGRPGIPSRVHLGTRVRKMRLPGAGPYLSPASTPVAEVAYGTLRLLQELPLPRPVNVKPGWEPVCWLRMYPGVPLPKKVKEELIMIELYPSSTAPARLEDFIDSHGDREVFLITPDGRTVSHDYPSGRFLGRATPLAMTPEAAYTKIGWAASSSDLRETVLNDICGETFRI
mgnify:CR=1 FL=1